MRRKITYWGATGLVAIVALLAAFAYLTTAPQAVENFRHVGYPPAVACPPRHREAGRSHRAAPATAADVEGMGLCRVYLHVDRGIRVALSGGRRGLVPAAARVDRVAGGFVRHAPGESPRFGEGDAAGRSRSKRDINAVTCSAGFMACTSCCRWECSRGGERCRGLPRRAWPFQLRESDPGSALREATS
jgi:hypothetical protein